MRPLVLAPIFFWLLSWFLGMFLTRLGMFLDLGRLGLAAKLARGLVFLWVWGSVFVAMWQILLLYLYRRFKRMI